MQKQHDTYIAAVINKPGEVSTFCGINDGVMIHSEHVTAAYAFILVSFFTHVSNDLRKTPGVESGLAAEVVPEQRSTQHSPELCLCHSTDIRSPTPQENTDLTENTEVQDGLLESSSPKDLRTYFLWAVENPTLVPPSHMPTSA